jgi:hypothetical protein
MTNTFIPGGVDPIRDDDPNDRVTKTLLRKLTEQSKKIKLQEEKLASLHRNFWIVILALVYAIILIIWIIPKIPSTECPSTGTCQTFATAFNLTTATTLGEQFT